MTGERLENLGVFALHCFDIPVNIGEIFNQMEYVVLLFYMINETSFAFMLEMHDDMGM